MPFLSLQIAETSMTLQKQHKAGERIIESMKPRLDGLEYVLYDLSSLRESCPDPYGGYR